LTAYQIPPLFVGALFALAGIPLILRRIPPNQYYGFRISKRVFKPEIWYPVNAFGGWMLLGVGVLLAALDMAMPYIPLPSDGARMNVIVSVTVVGTIAMAIASYAYLAKFDE